MEKKVFALEAGEYSDYHVIGIYTTKANAEAVRAVVGGDIVERILDPGLKEINSGLSRWSVLILRDGTIESVTRNDQIQSRNIGEGNRICIWKRTEAPAYRGKGIPDCLDCKVWARTEKAAVKIVNEKRAQMIAEGKWDR